MIWLYVNAVLSGALLSTLFPKLDFWFLSCFALIPYLFFIFFKREKIKAVHIFFSAFLLCATWNFLSIWWLSYVAVAAMFALSLLIALLFALTFLLAFQLYKKNIPAWLAFTSAWMIFEALVTYFLTGFPWLLLGYSWRKLLPLIQPADITGPYSISFLIVLFNVAFAELFVSKIKKQKLNYAALFSSFFILIIFYFYGSFRIHQFKKEQPIKKMSVACIQANIPSLIKHDPDRTENTLKKYAALTLRAAKKKPDLIIWPETALPGYFFDKRLSYKVVTNIVKHIKIPLLTGMCRREISPDFYLNYYNSAAMIEPSGEVIGLYDKMHLVMFGEYVPYEKIFPFFKLLTPIDGSFSCGRGARTLALPVNSNIFKFGALICFEDVFGYVAREMARAGAEILVNLTNDGWFHNSPEPYQHAALAAFRTIETRRPLIRVTNSGITTYINRYGKTENVLEENGKKVEISGFMFSEVPVYKDITTFYVRTGDWFIFSWCVIAAGLLLSTFIKK